MTLRESKARIIVTGLAVTYPFGGSFWDYVQYILGFSLLGHDVLYLEDTGQWCYDPENETYSADGTTNAKRFAANLGRLDPTLADSWFYKDANGQEFGRSWNSVVEFCRDADLFLHLSATCLLADEYLAARRVAFIDSDPTYTQGNLFYEGSAEQIADRVRWWFIRHDSFFTFGENLGKPGCRVPPGTFDWQPTRQPIVMSCFTPYRLEPSARRRALTTVASWEPREATIEIDDASYQGKGVEFLRFLDLPKQAAARIELALSGPFPRDTLLDAGFGVRSGLDVSRDPWSYRSYLADSLGEWSVAKNAYVDSRSGWFSCRTACYLALGVPAVVQDTGFSSFLPCGQGVHAFSQTEQALAAIDKVASHPETESDAAIEFAQAHFSHDKVLPSLLDRALATTVQTGDAL